MKKATSSLHGASVRDTFSRFIFESEHSLGLGGEGRSLTFRLCQLLVVSLRAVTPLSYLYVFCVWAFGIRAKHFGSYYPLFYVLLIWMSAEVLFLPYHYYLFVTFGDRNKSLEHVALSSADRFLLAKRCFTALALVAKKTGNMSTEGYIRKVVEGWFINVSLDRIHRDNLASWCAWAFFDTDYKELNKEENKDNEQIVDFIAKAAKWDFPPGFAEGVLPARLSLDPVFAVQRPLYFYLAIAALNAMTHVIMRHVLGFTRLQKYDAESQYVYFRPAKCAPGGAKKVPLVFVHGIGIGFAHYLPMIASFPTDTDVFLVEWPHVAMQMAGSGPTTAHAVSTICNVLQDFKHEKACFVAHSLGTCLVTWLLHDPRGCTVVHSTVLLDPVTFLLCDPTVATSFIYKNPTNTLEFLMHFFVSRELFIANGLSRHFSWSHNILFVEDYANINQCCRDAVKSQPFADGTLTTDEINSNNNDNKEDDNSATIYAAANKQLHHMHCAFKDTVNHTVILSSKDLIVPTTSVLHYLQGKQQQGHCTYEVLLFQGSHGEMMLHSKWNTLIAKKINKYCSSNGSSTSSGKLSGGGGTVG